jgi:competence protein ComEA
MIKNILSKVQDFFDFNAGERRGIIFLLIIIIGIILFRIEYAYILSKHISQNTEKEIEVCYTEQKQIEDSLKTNSTKSSDFYSTKSKLSPFPFNPNNLPEETWKQLGLTDKQISHIKNYEKKGGKFYSKEDLKKMYSISKEEYKILEPYICIPAENSNQSPQTYTKKNTLLDAKIEINSADSFDFQKIPGIGVKIASRIVKYRTLLGGFVNINQLKEVYGLDSNRYAEIKPYITLNPQRIHKININEATIKEMIKHPYMDYSLAKSIVVYREKKGTIQTLDELQKETAIPQKLLPYLSIN